MTSYRVEKMASNVRSIVSDVILNELNDPRVSHLTSVTRVELTRDLQLAKVFVSVLGSEGEGRRTMAGLEHATGHIQKVLASRLRARVCPHISLHLDESLKRTAEVLDLIRRSVGSSPSDDEVDFDQPMQRDGQNGATE